MSKIESLLVNARAAIDAKNFNAAIENCQNVLKIKKDSYMALVLLGVALQDQDEAERVFKKAISLKKESILAYNGLAKFYEKQGQSRLPDLLKTNCKIIQLDTTKCETVCKAIYEIAHKLNECKNCVDVLYNAASKETDEKRKEIIHSYLVKVLNEAQDAPWQELLLLYEKVIALNLRTELIEKTCNMYLQCIYINKGYDNMFESGMNLLKTHKSLSLQEFMCKIFCEAYILKFNFNIRFEEINSLQSELSSNPDSVIGSATGAIIELIKGNYLTAYEISVKLKIQNRLNPLMPLLYGHCCIALSRWYEAENSIKTLVRHANPMYANSAKCILLTALVSQEDPQQFSKAMTLKKHIETSLKESEYVALVRSCIHQKKIADAENYLTKLSGSAHCVSLKAALLECQGKTEEAFYLLSANIDSPSTQLPLGKMYMKNKDYQNAMVHLLHAANYDSHNYEIYILLGDCFTFMENTPDKSKKCYLKALELNFECSEAGKKLSQIYVKMKDWGSNYELLKMFLDSVVHLNPEPFQWIWFQLGHHYIALEQWDDAISNLRVYIRLNSSDVNAWEMLADSYFSRGSYTSALKCFNKVVDMDAARKYCFVQIGMIECMLGMTSQALITFKSMADEEYLPALKGMAEVKLCIAQEKLSYNFYGLSRDNAQEAMDLASKAILQNMHLSCLWEILYKAIMMVASLPAKYSWFYFDPEMSAEKKKYSVNDMYLLAIQCIEKAIGTSKTSSSRLYHELATAYYNYYEYSDKILFAKKAYIMVKKCIETETKNWQHWNLLGIICSSNDVKKYTLAQHAFMKALQLDPCNPTLWSNIGVFYSITGNVGMANQTFMKAQESNPSYLQSWIGQALIAELIGQHEDALDLFRHASQLGFHKVSSLGYAYWITNEIISSNKIGSNLSYSIEHMNAIPKACDLISMYNEYCNENPCSWNIYGILLEKMGQFSNAINAFLKALNYVHSEHKNIVLLNLGRLYYKTESYSLAIDTIISISELDFNAVCLLADCYFKNNQLKEAYITFSKALEYNAIGVNDKAEILMSLANIAIKCNCKEHAELLIFQCINLQYSTQEVLRMNPVLSLCASSLLFSDKALSTLTLKELKVANYDNSTILLLETYYIFKFYPLATVVKFLSKNLKTNPDNPHIWKLMAKISTNNYNIVNVSSKKAICFGSPVDHVSLLKLACVSEFFIGSRKKSAAFAQKTIKSAPGDAENWSLLVNVLSQNQNDSRKDKSKINEWLRNVISHIIHNFSMKTTLFDWFSTAVKSIEVS